jgi:outer membrane lipoprotein-sorting protein
MKTLYFLMLLLLTGLAAFCQQDARAKAILTEVSHKYKSYDVIKTDFTYTIESPQQGVKETRTGILIARSKLNQFKVSLFDDSKVLEEEIISDGSKQWTYNKKDKEVQLSEAGKGDDALNPANIFTLYEKGYKYLYTGESKIGTAFYQMIDLTPTNAKSAFFKIRLTIDKAKKQIYSLTVFDKNGSHYGYTIKAFVPNFTASADTFTFNAKLHPGVEVVDLR